MALITRDGFTITAAPKPCKTCPWRKSQAGKHAGNLPESIDSAAMSWGCHSAEITPRGDSLRVCAGYLAADDETFLTPHTRAIGHLPSKAEARARCGEKTFRTYAELLDAEASVLDAGGPARGGKR